MTLKQIELFEDYGIVLLGNGGHKTDGIVWSWVEIHFSIQSTELPTFLLERKLIRARIYSIFGKKNSTLVSNACSTTWTTLK